MPVRAVPPRPSLEGDVTAVADDLGADLDQLPLSDGQRGIGQDGGSRVDKCLSPEPAAPPRAAGPIFDHPETNPSVSARGAPSPVFIHHFRTFCNAAFDDLAKPPLNVSEVPVFIHCAGLATAKGPTSVFRKSEP
jgi:hypothetical protein